MASMLSTCSGCGVLVRADDDACPHYGVRRRSVSAPLAGGVMLLGLMLAGCPADDSTETMGGSATATTSTTNGGTETSGSTMTGGASMTSTSGMTMSSTTDDPGTTSAQPPYGVPDTTTTGEPDTDTDTDGSDSTTGAPKLDLPPDDG
jgi:hypothetical protein